MIYVLEDLHSGYVKIGFSEFSAHARSAAQIRSSPYDLRLVAIFDGDKAEEHRLHSHFEQARIRRTEWFRPLPSVKRFVDLVAPRLQEERPVVTMAELRAAIDLLDKAIP